jgi:hypothetical protein
MRILCRSGGALLTVLAMLLCTAALLAAPVPARAERTRMRAVTGVKAAPAALTAALVPTAQKSNTAPYSPHAVAGHTFYNTNNAGVSEPDSVGVPQPVPRE